MIEHMLKLCCISNILICKFDKQTANLFQAIPFLINNHIIPYWFRLLEKEAYLYWAFELSPLVKGRRDTEFSVDKLLHDIAFIFFLRLPTDLTLGEFFEYDQLRKRENYFRFTE